MMNMRQSDLPDAEPVKVEMKKRGSNNEKVPDLKDLPIHLSAKRNVRWCTLMRSGLI